MQHDKLEPMFPPKDPLYPPGVAEPLFPVDLEDPVFHNRHMDPLGSWTGNPADPYEQPVQDADDL